VSEPHRIPITDGCIPNLHYESHSRGNNWVATVTRDKSKPGGLERAFWRRGSGNFVQVPSDLQIGSCLEMAGDYMTGRGGKRPNRGYFQVVGFSRPVEDQTKATAVIVQEIPKKSIPAEGDNDINPLTTFSDKDLLDELKRRGVQYVIV